MLRPICYITIIKEDGSTYEFDFCNKIEVKSSFDTYTDTAKVVLPRKLSFKGKNLFTGSSAIFKRGDQINIQAGYFPDLKTIFDGFISYVGGSLPVELECEDAMFILKKTPIETYVKKQVSLKQLLTDILPSSIEFKALDVELGSFRFSHVTVTQILNKLKEEYGFYSYFVNGILNVGFPSDASDTNTEEFEFERTIINDSSLKYQTKEELFIKVVAISMQSDNSKKKVTVGDADGSIRTFHIYNASVKALKEFANLKLDAVKYTGYIGSFTTFGEPFIRHGDAAKLISNKLPERDGNYQVSEVTRTFGMDGYRQDIGLNTIL